MVGDDDMTRPTPRKSERGQILVFTAVSLVALMGISALSIDASFMYDKRNRLYAAADAAAKTGAIEVQRTPSLSQMDLEAFGNQQVTANGFNPAGPATLTIRRCSDPSATCSAPYSGNSNFVEAIVSEPTATFFGRVLGWLTATPGARAVAGPGPGPNCLVLLKDVAGAPETLDIGLMNINMPNCGLVVNGNLNTNPPTKNDAINAQSIGVHLTCLGPACPQPRQVLGVPASPDPLLGKYTRPANPGGCLPAIEPTSPLDPGCYTTIQKNGGLLTLNSGIFYVPGPILIGNNTTVRSQGFPNSGGVLIFLAGAAPGAAQCDDMATAGCIDVRNGPKFELNAMMSGPYSALLMWQAGTAATPNRYNATFDGNMGISDHYDLRGAMYFPDANVSFRNGLNATNDCMLFVAWSLKIVNGSGDFSNVCAGFGGSPLRTVSMAE